uniref:ZU5 domain-containing protein n=1 Tax=Petromyzon marinus TaxID=7757 RepID=S4RQD0_PETMA
LLDKGANPNVRALNGFTPLHIACKKNRIRVMELLLKYGASIEAVTESGLTPMHVSAFMGNLNIVLILLQGGASPNATNVRGETALHMAARAGQTEVVRSLLRNGAQVDAKAREEQTPLHIAARLGKLEIVQLLLQHMASPDAATSNGYTPLHVAAREGHEDVTAILLEHGASLAVTTKKGFTPLHVASKYGKMEVASLLLQRFASPDAAGKNGLTPLHVASHYDNQKVALLLLDQGASPHATAKNGYTPLHIAAKKDQLEIATTLLEYGAETNAITRQGVAPLHLGAQEGHADVASLLLARYADVNHATKSGLSPLHLAAQEDKVNVAEILVKHGAHVNATTKLGYTPLIVACHYGNIKMVNFLLQHGADVNSKTKNGYTPLHQAAQQGHTHIVNLLLKCGARPNDVTVNGNTALAIARRLGYISVVDTLKVVTEETITSTTVSNPSSRNVPETMTEVLEVSDDEGEDTMTGDGMEYLRAEDLRELGDDSLPSSHFLEGSTGYSMGFGNWATRSGSLRSFSSDRSYSLGRGPYSREATLIEEFTAATTITQLAAPKEEEEEKGVGGMPTSWAPIEILDNVALSSSPIHSGFLVSFMVDARGGSMRGCRHHGLRIVIPPRKCMAPTRVTCRLVKRHRLAALPPVLEGEGLASRVVEVGPSGGQFLGPVIVEIPHFASLRGKERELVVLRSENGETWREHQSECSEEELNQIINGMDEGADCVSLAVYRCVCIVVFVIWVIFFLGTFRYQYHNRYPFHHCHFINIIINITIPIIIKSSSSHLRFKTFIIPLSTKSGLKISSPWSKQGDAWESLNTFYELAQPVECCEKCAVEIMLTLMTLTGGTAPAQWEDITGTTPLTFTKQCVSFTTNVSARFWLIDCRQTHEAVNFTTQMYRELVCVPYMAKFVVFAKTHDPVEARLRCFCMTDDKVDKTLEQQENFSEMARSRDVEVLEGKPIYVECFGNLVPLTKAGQQHALSFYAFRENRLPFMVKIRDSNQEACGRLCFMKDAKTARGLPQAAVCNLNIMLPPYKKV